jgi:PTS system sucrose-specific IIC component
MALDYRKCAEEIYSHLGGRENIVQAAHCATRLRLVLADNSKIDKKALEDVEGVKGMFESNGQVQLIIGTGTVNKVYEEFLAVTGMTAATKDDVKAAAAAKAPVWKQALKSIGDVFVPILPAIVASGLMMGLVEALGKAIPSFEQSDWYGFLDMVANTAFAFLPVIVAISAARVFGGNIFLGGVIGLLMVHTGLLNGWNVANTDAINSFFGVTDGNIPTWNLFGDIKIGGYVLGSISRHGYQGHVIPVIISVWCMCKIEKWLHKHVPEMIDLFVVPLCTVLSTALITFVVIGPIFAQLENWVLAGAEVLVKNPLGAMVMGAIYPLTVVMGLHHMYNVIEAGMLSSVGLNTWMPIASAANFAQFGACLAVGIKSRQAKTKTVAVPSSMSAALGITEPAIFGVNFRFMKPFICAMIGGAIGAIFGALTGIGASAYGVTGIPGYLTINNPVVYTILLLISGGIAFGLTMFVWKEEKPAEEKVAEESEPEEASAEEASSTEKAVFAPIKGNVIKREDIPDKTFASGMLGEGVGIEPAEGVVVAPFDGTVILVQDTKHAVALTGPGDMEMLIHVGIDTVAMHGDGFETFVNPGDTVKKGQKLITFDIEKIKAAGYSPTTAVLIGNSDTYDKVDIIQYGPAEIGDKLVEVE